MIIYVPKKMNPINTTYLCNMSTHQIDINYGTHHHVTIIGCDDPINFGAMDEFLRQLEFTNDEQHIYATLQRDHLIIGYISFENPIKKSRDHIINTIKRTFGELIETVPPDTAQDIRVTMNLSVGDKQLAAVDITMPSRDSYDYIGEHVRDIIEPLMTKLSQPPHT